MPVTRIATYRRAPADRIGFLDLAVQNEVVGTPVQSVIQHGTSSIAGTAPSSAVTTLDSLNTFQPAPGSVIFVDHRHFYPILSPTQVAAMTVSDTFGDLGGTPWTMRQNVIVAVNGVLGSAGLWHWTRTIGANPQIGKVTVTRPPANMLTTQRLTVAELHNAAEIGGDLGKISSASVAQLAADMGRVPDPTELVIISVVDYGGTSVGAPVRPSASWVYIDDVVFDGDGHGIAYLVGNSPQAPLWTSLQSTTSPALALALGFLPSGNPAPLDPSIETFNKPDSTILGPGMAWTEMAAGGSSVNIGVTANMARLPAGAGTPEGAALGSFNCGSFNQIDEVTLGNLPLPTGTDSIGAGVIGRMVNNGAAGWQGYIAIRSRTATQESVQLQKRVNGVSTSLVFTPGVGVFSPSDVLRLVIRDTPNASPPTVTLQIFLNGLQVGTDIIDATSPLVTGTQGGIFLYRTNVALDPAIDQYHLSALAPPVVPGAPTVTNVTSSTVDGVYTTAAVVSIQVTFSSVVNVTGTPSIALNSGGTAVYSGGSGTNVLAFSYTVGANDNATDLNYVTTSAMLLNNGTIRDTSLRDADMTLPGLASVNSLAFNKNLVIVGGAVSKGSVAWYGDSLTGGDGFWVGYVGNGLISDLTGAGFGPVVVHGCGGQSLAQWIGRVAPTAGDACETANTLPNHTSEISTAKYVMVQYIANDTASSSAQFQADVNTAINNIKAANPSVQRIFFIKNFFGNGVHDSDLLAVAQTQPLMSVIDPSAAYPGSYAATCADVNNQNHPTQTCSINLGREIVRLMAGVVNTPVVVTAATITNVTSSLADGTYGTSQVVPIQVTFSKPVTVTGTPSLLLNTGETAVYAGGSGTSVLTFNYTVLAGDNTPDLNYVNINSLVLNGGTITS